MDQQLITIIVLFGFRFVLLAIPVFDNFWVWAMRRVWGGWRYEHSEEHSESLSVEGGQQVIELHELTSEMDNAQLRLPEGIIFIPAAVLTLQN